MLLRLVDGGSPCKTSNTLAVNSFSTTGVISVRYKDEILSSKDADGTCQEQEKLATSIDGQLIVANDCQLRQVTTAM